MVNFTIRLFFAVLLSFSHMLVNAQVPPFYNQTPAGGNNSFPFNQTGGKSVQWLVAPNEFAIPSFAPAGNNITQIWFYSNAGTATFTNLSIKLGQIPSIADPSWAPAGLFTGSLTTVYFAPSVTLTSPGPPGWMSITLTTPFLYDPSQALVVEVTQCGSVGGFTIPQATMPNSPRRKYINTPSCTLSYVGQDATLPGIGLTLIPATPCSGQPAGGTANAAPMNPCPGAAVTLSLTGATVGGNMSYQWLQSTSGNPGTWAPIPGGTSSTYNYVPAVGSTNFFRCIVTCLNSSLFDTSLVVGPVTTQPWSPTSPCYCGTSQATSNLNTDIFNVSMASLNNTTDCINPLVGTQGAGTGIGSRYADFTSINAPILYSGLAQNFSMTVGSCATSGNSGAKIYIDYNHNATFTDPGEEVYFSGLTAFPTVPATVLNGSFTVPVTALPGPTRMRVIAQVGGAATATTITPCGSYTTGETEDYVVNIIPPAPYDPGILSMTSPSGNCYTANSTITAQLRNFGANPIDLSVNPVTVTLNVNTPTGLVQYNSTASTGLLTPYGGSGVTVLFTGVNMYAGGTYTLNTTLTIAGLTNGNLFNDSLPNPIVKINVRPTAGAPYQLCQFESIPFGQGLTATGCATPLFDSVTINFNITPCIDNVGATGTGISLGDPARCSNQFAGQLGNAPLPVLPPGAYFTQNAKLQVTNMSSTGMTQVRFILYGDQPLGSGLFAGCPTGFNFGANNPLIGGQSLGNFMNFSNYRDITPAQLANMFNPANNPNSVVNLGYWETFNNNAANSDVTFNAGNPTTASLKIYYAYLPANFEWYSVPSGGVNLSSISPFNPLITTGSGLTNSNTTGTYTWFAACQGSSNCRVPVNLTINPTPAAFQDSLASCEYAVSSNSAIFDLTSLNSSVSGNNPLASVEYYLDEPLFSLVPNPTNDTSSTNVLYSKVFYPATGCYSKDTVLLQVNPLPELVVNNGFACAPNAIDVSTLINPFSTSPSGTDTLYYEDPGYTIPFANPNAVNTTDTVYLVFATNTNPVCADSAVVYVDVTPATNTISGQVIPGNYSNAGSYGCMSGTLLDGQSDTIRSTVDCKRVAAITDIPNSNSLGTVSACLEIAPGTLFHNTQPYLNRTLQITAQNSDTAEVCLYFLDEDFLQYNADASFFGWPLLPTAVTTPLNLGNVAVTKVDNGDLNTPGHVATAISNAQINASYDPSTTVWTVCFPVSGFSYFYLHAQNPGNVPLPVTLLNFTGRREGVSSVLSWTTVTEQNNRHFVLERSRNGISFSAVSNEILSKAPGGNSQSPLQYGFTDASPFNGHNYYRLRQVDLDGNTSYSKVVDVYFGNENIVTVYPNPARSLLNVDVQTPVSTTAELSLSDATGRTVRVLQVKLQGGQNTVQMDVQDLADGVYMLRLSNGKGLEYSQKVNKN